VSRLDDLSRGRRDYLAASWPSNPQLGRPDPIPVKLQALSDDDFQECVAAAHERFRKLKIPHDGMSADDFEAEVSIQLLARACRDPEQPDKVAFVQDADDLRRNTTSWERAEVGEIWKTYQERRNPTRALLPEERARIDALVKKKDPMILRAVGLDSLVSYMLTSGNPPSN
jgi:hypothetical protein